MVSLLVSLAAWATVTANAATPSKRPPPVMTQHGWQAAHYAYAQIGTGERTDSVGLVRAAFAQAGLDPFDAPAAMDPGRTGVDVVYQWAARNGRLHERRVPNVGDLVFLRGTRDVNRDGVADGLSHLGIVVSLSADGTAHVVTATRAGVTALKLNRLRPADSHDEAGQELNSQLLLPALGASATPPSRRLSELFYTFATID